MPMLAKLLRGKDQNKAHGEAVLMHSSKKNVLVQSQSSLPNAELGRFGSITNFKTGLNR